MKKVNVNIPEILESILKICHMLVQVQGAVLLLVGFDFPVRWGWTTKLTLVLRLIQPKLGVRKE